MVLLSRSATPSSFVKKGYWQGYVRLALPPHQVLILGYGAGTADALLREKYPDVEVTGVEIEPVIATRARELLFPNLHSNVYIQSAQEFLTESTARFDVILCDIFRADRVDESVFDDGFWTQVKFHLTPAGQAIINRILPKDEDEPVTSFTQLLQRHFRVLDIVKIHNPTRRYNCLFYVQNT